MRRMLWPIGCALLLATPPLRAAEDKPTPPLVVPVWPGDAPGSESWTRKEVEYRNDWDHKTMVRNVVRPTLTAFLPDRSKATGTAVIICPGGAFRFLSWESEGTEVAEWLRARGVAAFVLKYRLTDTGATAEEFREAMKELASVMANRDRPDEARKAVEELASADGRQAVKVVRRNAAEWGIAPDRIGVMGFSAGGMVTMGVVMNHDADSRPNFAAPIYGGRTGDAKIPADAPPLFILCASDDDFAAKSSVDLYSAWKNAGRPAELHLYSKGGHGFGMNKRGLPVDSWIERFGDWLGAQGLLKPAEAKAKKTADSSPVTFNKQIAPLLFKHCVECHRPGEVAPFSLLTYADAKKRAKLLQTVVSEREMPPWKIVEGHGAFVGERRLTVEEIDRIGRWAEQGAPEGDPGDLPAAPKFAEGWRLGKPDIVITMPRPFEVPADGPDVYRNFVFKLDVPKGKYIKAAEYRPANRRVVHHGLMAVDTTGRARKEDDADPAPGYKGSGNIPGELFPGGMATWTPGRDPIPLADGMSMPWKPNADLVLQLHLHPSGKPEVEQSSVGFYLTDQPPQRSSTDLLLINQKIDIAPGDKSYRTRDELTLPIDMEVVGVFPHMHLIGRDIKVTAHPPQGKPFSLLWIDDWNFDWQNFYQYVAPVKLAAGTRVVVEAVHDNSADNPRNPSQPPKRVTWGEETTNEMTIVFLQVAPAREPEFRKLAEALRSRMLGAIVAKPSDVIK
ncbi:alpha/beta hydrolase [Paludisphaera borealis]|uniref:Dienelactone hydrolase domain-containing protein n=1 Tax=Paludisphaera borealis TaxID=1387353 RepID=A0A1U7CRV8_9BACT|nr:alpha/beta hydrolase [Paludisphaera borealis]APW61613.1 hypothetical protein BSF38_03135 [Paludisphaera borealis]